MKLIIDIPDHIYSMVTNTGTFGCYRFNTSKAIRQGIPLDKVRAEILKMRNEHRSRSVDYESISLFAEGLDKALRIIDRYRERSDKE